MAGHCPQSDALCSDFRDTVRTRRLRVSTSWLAIFAVFVAHARGDTVRVPADHSSIQSAIDTASAGDTVLVSAGTYHERIRIRAGVAVRSEGDDSRGESGLQRAERTIIDGDGASGTAPGVLMAQGSVLDGFTVTNVGVYDDKSWNQHHATYGNQQAHEHIGAPGTPGIGMTGVDCRVSNNVVHHIGYTGIAIQGVDGKQCQPLVTNNVCYRNMGAGIGSMKKSAALIEGNICFQNFYAGIGHDNASPMVINNDCYENIRAGVGISEGACPVVRGNKCHKNRRAGIGVRTGGNTQPIIEDNDCFGNHMAGIGAEEEASPVIRRNRCFKNKLAGIGIRSHATATITNNNCYENDSTGIGQESDAVTTLIGNQCHHNGESGIGFAACSAGRSVVTKNTVFDNAKVAVGIHSGWKVVMSANRLSRAGGLPPIMMVFAGADVTLTDNVIEGGGVAGVRVAGRVRFVHNDLVGTSLRKVGPPNFAVWALPGADITMTDNTARNWRHALHATESMVHARRNRIESFHGAAIVVKNAPNPVSIVNNTAVSANPDDKVVLLTDTFGMVRDNMIVVPDTIDAEGRQ
ncbi:MAG: right-handed parallel beta-helix repeat-containing protein [Fuerstiella sp.]|nr:right-handed parallel beta-helix repeat-containing protein [Fuerstiella sp.]